MISLAPPFPFLCFTCFPKLLCSCLSTSGQRGSVQQKGSKKLQGTHVLKKVCGKIRLIISLEITTAVDMEFHHLLPSFCSIWGVNAYERNMLLVWPNLTSYPKLTCFAFQQREKIKVNITIDLEIHFIRQTQQRVLPTPVTDSWYILLGVQGPVNHPFPAGKPGSTEHSVLHQKAPSPE